jgi:predicted secreted protein
MAKIRALGTKIEFGAAEIKSLSSIGEVSVDSDEQDVTTLDSPGGYREFLQGFKDSGEVALSGFYDSTDAGQQALITAYGTGTPAATVITLPSAAGTVSFNSYVKSYAVGAAEVDGAVGYSATLRITGAVTVA